MGLLVWDVQSLKHVIKQSEGLAGWLNWLVEREL